MALVNERAPNRTPLLAAAVLGVLALVVVAVLALGGGDDNGGEATTRSPSREKDTQASNGPGVKTATLSADNVRYEEFLGVSLPVSKAGPGRTADGRASAFERSPDGAVLAAIHILYRAGASAGPAVYEPTINDQVLGSDKEAFLAKIQAEYSAAAPSGTGPSGELAGAADQAKAIQSSVWAYRLEAYDASVVPVQLLLRSVPAGADPLYVNLALTVRWSEGDWRLVAPLNGEFASVARKVPDVPTGYVVLGQG